MLCLQERHLPHSHVRRHTGWYWLQCDLLGAHFPLQMPELFFPASWSMEFQWCWLPQLRDAHSCVNQNLASANLGQISCSHFCHLLPEIFAPCNMPPDTQCWPLSLCHLESTVLSLCPALSKRRSSHSREIAPVAIYTVLLFCPYGSLTL